MSEEHWGGDFNREPSNGRYVMGCRCAECTELHRVWNAGWRKARLAAGELHVVGGYWYRRGEGPAEQLGRVLGVAAAHGTDDDGRQRDQGSDES